MSKCSCDKTACTYPECDDGSLLVPVWNRVHTAQALANLAAEIAKLQARVETLEHRVATLKQTISDNTWLDTRVETLEQTIKDMEADS